jgi:hypothetical protein
MGMNWKIIERKFDGTNLLVDIECDPSNDPLRQFIGGVGVSLYRMPEFLDSVVQSEGFVMEFAISQPYSVMDWEDIRDANGIKEGEVRIYHEVYGSMNLSEELYHKIVYDFCKKILEVYRNNPATLEDYEKHRERRIEADSFDKEFYLHSDPNWVIAMQDGIKKLEEKIKGMS